MACLAGSNAGVHSGRGEFVIPALLGGPNALMIGRVLWDEFFSNRVLAGGERRRDFCCSYCWFPS